MSLFNLTEHFHKVVARNKVLDSEYRHMRNLLMQARMREGTLVKKLNEATRRTVNGS